LANATVASETSHVGRAGAIAATMTNASKPKTIERRAIV
jgi:hypothetical protein